MLPRSSTFACGRLARIIGAQQLRFLDEVECAEFVVIQLLNLGPYRDVGIIIALWRDDIVLIFRARTRPGGGVLRARDIIARPAAREIAFRRRRRVHIQQGSRGEYSIFGSGGRGTGSGLVSFLLFNATVADRATLT